MSLHLPGDPGSVEVCPPEARLPLPRPSVRAAIGVALLGEGDAEEALRSLLSTTAPTPAPAAARRRRGLEDRVRRSLRCRVRLRLSSSSHLSLDVCAVRCLGNEQLQTLIIDQGTCGSVIPTHHQPDYDGLSRLSRTHGLVKRLFSAGIGLICPSKLGIHSGDPGPVTLTWLADFHFW